MTADRTTSLASLASLMNLSVAATVVLPTAVTVAASKVGMPEGEFLFRLHNNAALRAYVAQVCTQVAA